MTVQNKVPHQFYSTELCSQYESYISIQYVHNYIHCVTVYIVISCIVLKLILIDFSHHNGNRSRLLPGILQPYDKQTFSFTLRYRDLLLPGAGAGDCRHAAIGVGGTRATACAQHEDHGLEQCPARRPADRHPCSEVSVSCRERDTRTNTSSSSNACLLVSSGWLS